MSNPTNFTAYQPERVDAPTLLIVPGLGNSGAQHWQSLWENMHPDARRADLGDWGKPAPDTWIARLDEAINDIDGPVLIAAHSLGCHAVVQWAKQRREKSSSTTIGALLVAPPEIDRGLIDWRLQPFAPSSQSILPFPSILVASQNDPYIHLERARRLAFFWGSQFADAGAVGHINADSGIGAWEFGQFLLKRVARLIASVSSTNDEYNDSLNTGGQPPGRNIAHTAFPPIITA